MGSCFSLAHGPEGLRERPSCSPLHFHPAIKGSQIAMDRSLRIANRTATFRNGIVFSNRPVALHEKVTVKILKEEGKWHGGLRVGFTWEDPSLMEPSSLPPFACPDLVEQGKCCARILPDEYAAEGTIISFWVDGQGQVFCSTNHGMEGCILFSGVPVETPLWAVLDVYGTTKAVQLLDPSDPPTNADGHSLLLLDLEEQNENPCAFPEASCEDFRNLLVQSPRKQQCAICFESMAATVMLPCTHANFCTQCAVKILRTSRRCPLCRQQVKKIVYIFVLAREESAEFSLEEAKNIQLPR